GKEFRNSFDKLGNLTCLFPDVPHLALTATATKSDIARLSEVLQYRDTQFVIANPDRPNIYLEIRSRLPNIRKFEKFDNILAEIVSELSDKLDRYPVTIAYCNNLEAIGYAYVYTEQKLGPRAYIPQEGVPENRIFGQYHKDYSEKMKLQIVSELSKPQPKLRLVFASVALGMGLNAPSISQIIHFRPPTTLEKYFQEVGRAGRSGQSAKAIMFFNKNDVASNRKGMDPSIKEYVNTEGCLRKYLMKYFGFETVLYSGMPELCCSNCRKIQGS
ncbi:bifunctional 3'-5' exonuclease/ATP-dependent helicase WRN-like, partial [Saccostrea cucullata]|uniref:bifunctional 3'-5' exonuclease/ATP-dependent helicase WRN-like n=1 Tax=Saccostrea cuccullata TaxID=36930 RepID=UPI002ED45D2D